MQIKDMNSEQLKALIENTIDETLESYFGDYNAPYKSDRELR